MRRYTTATVNSRMWRRKPSVITILLAVVAAASRVTVAQVPVNEMCPVMTEEPVNPEFTRKYQGQVIGFCCDKCLAKFEANPSRYAARMAELHDPKPQPAEADRFLHDQGKAQSAGVQERGAGGSHAHNESAAQTGEQGERHEHDGHKERDEPAIADHVHKHDHAHGQGFFARLIGWLGKFHPPTVNFPIAMIVGSALAEVFLIVTGRAFFASAGRFCLWVGALGALAGGTLGWFLGGFHFVDDSWVLTTHRWLGTTTAAWSVLLLVCGERTFRRTDATRRGFRVLLFIGAGLVGVTGFFGGSLIYGITHYAWQ